MKGRGENAWLLLKKDDEYATTKDILKKVRSVKTRKVLRMRKPGNASEKRTTRKTTTAKTNARSTRRKTVR
jgi:bifunctional non-homologous end joining protein LigD